MPTRQLPCPAAVPPPLRLAAGVALCDRAPAHPTPAAHDALALVVAAAGEFGLDDREAATRLRAAAHRVTAHLATVGWLPAHLVVGLDDPDVVVGRTLTVAARRLAPPSADGPHGDRPRAREVPRTAAGFESAGPSRAFDALYDELVAAWHARLTLRTGQSTLAQRADAEERYRAARAAIRAWLEREE